MLMVTWFIYPHRRALVMVIFFVYSTAMGSGEAVNSVGRSRKKLISVRRK